MAAGAGSPLAMTGALWGRPTRVLVVTREPRESDRLCSSLAEADSGCFDVLACARLSASLELLRREPIDLVLLDLSLPDAFGTVAVERIHTEHPETAVIVLTATDDDGEIASRALRLGAQDCLVAPAPGGEGLGRTIRNAIERHGIGLERDRLTRELREANAQLELLTMLDPLTALLNRRGLEEALRREVQWVAREGSDLVAVLIDLDDFKRINDQFGHAGGDVALRAVAMRMRRCLRGTDHVARIGGDEFLVLLPRTRFAEGVAVAEKVRLEIGQLPVQPAPGVPVTVTASLGVVSIRRDTRNLEQLLSEMRTVFRRSKSSGKNQVVPQASLPSAPPFDFRREGAIVAMAQPIVELAAGRPVGMEFLCRMPGTEFAAPEDFFRAARDAGVLPEVDRQCLRACVERSREFPPALRRFVNLFPATLLQSVPDDLLGAFPPEGGESRFCIEISERQMIGDPTAVARAAAGLRRAGIQVAVDDLGYGRSSLESLILLEPDVVKIDRRLVSGAPQNPDRARCLDRLSRIARSVGAEVIAEGVETEREIELLLALGVTHGQGYFWGMPA